MSRQLASLLKSYPAQASPWLEKDEDAVLSALLAGREDRISRLAAALRPFVIDVAALMSAEPLALVDALDRWSAAHWRSAAGSEWADPEHFRKPVWAQPAQASTYTLIVDMGVVMGEAVLQLRPGLAWAVDRYEAHEADGVSHFGQVVVLDPAVPKDARSPAVFDAIDVAFMRYQCLAYDQPLEPFIEGMRGLLWSTHRYLYAG
ncbi:hypothetical protein BURC_01001 [Burkholderiaceae bacterium]|nr:hypothetical protein BURC_01001 [Burkholderiaceae bacterium]